MMMIVAASSLTFQHHKQPRHRQQPQRQGRRSELDRLRSVIRSLLAHLAISLSLSHTPPTMATTSHVTISQAFLRDFDWKLNVLISLPHRSSLPIRVSLSCYPTHSLKRNRSRSLATSSRPCANPCCYSRSRFKARMVRFKTSTLSCRPATSTSCWHHSMAPAMSSSS